VRPEPLDDMGVSIVPVPRQRVAVGRVQRDLVLLLVLLEQRGELQRVLDRHPRIAATVEQQHRHVDLAGPVDRGAAREVLGLVALEIGPHRASAGPAHAAKRGVVSLDELRAPRLHAEIGHAGNDGRGVPWSLPPDGNISHRPGASVCLSHEADRRPYSDRSACSTSTRDARAAGISDATIAALMSTAAAPLKGSAPGSCTVSKNPSATRAST